MVMLTLTAETVTTHYSFLDTLVVSSLVGDITSGSAVPHSVLSHTQPSLYQSWVLRLRV